MKSLSVCLRLRRVRVEHAFVAVPLTPELLREDGMDVEKLLARAADLGRRSGLPWSPEGEDVVEVHPLQTPLPEGMNVFRPDGVK